MHSTRILSLVLFFLTFGLFVSAGPIENTNAIAKRCNTCSSGELDLIKILTDLQVGVQVDIDAAMKAGGCPRGESPSDTVQLIIAKINAAAKVIATVKITSSSDEGKTAIAQLCVNLIISICIYLSKCSIVLLITIGLQIDACLSALINICVQVCGGLLVYLTACIKANVNLNIVVSLKLILTLAACGCSALGL